MVILITGATHTGKTVLAQTLLERYHYPYLSIDQQRTDRAYAVRRRAADAISMEHC